mgnify:CR=1 FL=1
MSVLYPQMTLLEIYRGVGYVCLELVVVNAGHMNPHLRKRTLSGSRAELKLKLAYMRLRGGQGVILSALRLVF